MQGVRYFVMALLLSGMVACSSSGKGGTGMGEEGNIPVARAGGELGDVNFAYDSSSLSGVAQGVLRQNASWVLDNPSSKVVIEGHCDERGTAEYNLALGERRARATHEYLRSLGIRDNQMNTISYGEELPLDPGHSEGAWSKNRRAHFSIQ